MAKIALAEMIEELRRELQTAVQAGKDEEIRFGLGEVTLEAQVEVKRTVEGKAGVKFWVAELGASGGGSKGVTQKIVLKLRPVDSDGSALKLADEERDRWT